MKQKRFAALLAALLLLAACAAPNSAAAAPEPPVSSSEEASAPEAVSVSEPEPESAREPFAWPEETPAAHGMDEALLEQLPAALSQTKITSMVVIKDGALVSEWYSEGNGPDTAFPMHSCSKSFTGTIVGAALDDGLIGSIDDPIGKYLPEAVGTDKENITVRQLLNQTSGIEWHEWNGEEQSFWGLYNAENWVDFVLSQPLIHEPGTTWTYTTGGSHLLAAVVGAAAGKSSAAYGYERLFSKMDMDSITWNADPQGVTDGGNGVVLTSRDAAKLGQLYLDGGVWQGERLLSEEWVSAATSRQSDGSAGRSGRYGYQWWLQTFAGYPTYYAMGFGGQFIFVVPELKLVTVFTTGGWGDTYAPWPYFTDYVLAACR